MSFEYKLPDVGEGLTEAEIVSWRVKQGDVIEINDIVVEIETAKSLVELPSPYAGTVQALLVPEGETVAVGTPLIRIGDPAEQGGAASEASSQSRPASGPASGAVGRAASEASGQSRPSGGPSAAPADLSQMDLSNPAASGGGEGESLVGRNKADRGPVRRARRAASPASAAGSASQQQLQGAFVPGGAQGPGDLEDLQAGVGDESPVPAQDARSDSTSGAPPTEPSPAALRALATPPVRKLARDRGIDLTQVQGTGPQGSVTRADLDQHGSGDGRTEMPAQYDGRPGDLAETGDARPGQLREWREPVKGVRKMMGQAMVASAFTAPHVTEWVTVDVTRTMDFVERLRSRRELRDLKVSPLLVLARACILAMRRTPVVNSTWDEAAQEIVFKRYVNLGIAAATPRGLVVPNVKDADRLSLTELAQAFTDLTATAREGRTPPADMSGGTFTITNVGVFGVDAGTPIINPGESAIMCFGAVRKQPWVVSDEEGDRIAVRQVTQLALSFDHRHVDGQAGSQFLADVAAIMEDPATALLF